MTPVPTLARICGGSPAGNVATARYLASGNQWRLPLLVVDGGHSFCRVAVEKSAPIFQFQTLANVSPFAPIYED